MLSYAICLTSLTGLFLVHGQTSAAKVCWNSKWYNNSAPTAGNRSEYETQSVSVLDSICTNGKVIAAQCRDEKGEPFTGFKNDTINHYFATCNIITGLICNPYNSPKARCADFEIQYGCACPTTSTTTVASAAAVSRVGVTSNVGVTVTAGKPHSQCGNGVPGYGISQTMLILCMIRKMLV